MYGGNASYRLHSYQDSLMIIQQKKEVQYQVVTKGYFRSAFKMIC